MSNSRAPGMRDRPVRHLVQSHLLVAVVDGDDEPLEELETEDAGSWRKARSLIVGERQHRGGLIGDFGFPDAKVRDGDVAGLVHFVPSTGRCEPDDWH